MNIQSALQLDCVIFVASAFIVWQTSRRSIFNPSIWYLALHAYVVTFRLVMLNLGSRSVPIAGIESSAELVKAAIACDLSLIGATIATMVASRRRGISHPVEIRTVPLNFGLGQVISILCLVVGTCFLLTFGKAASMSLVDIGRFEQSSYPIVIAGFAVQGALIQCAMRGFARWRRLAFIVLLFITSYNLARTAFVLATLIAFLIMQARRRKETLPMRWAIGFLILGVVWFVYKPVGRAIGEGQDIKTIVAIAQTYLDESIQDDSSNDAQFLDLQATNMTAVDEAGLRFYGSTALPLIYLPIPRFLWPDKPRMSEYAIPISTPSRPIAAAGLTPNLSGEAYLNFGWIGCVIVPFCYVLGMQALFRRVNNQRFDSADRWIYMILLVTFVQVFRDGLNSLVTYPLVVYLPLLIWGVLSKVAAVYGERIPRLHIRKLAEARSARWE